MGGAISSTADSSIGAVACAACHRFAQEGGLVGPDLSGVVGRFSVRDLLEATVEPSKVISDQYAAISILKKNGEIVTGRVANLSGDSLQIVQDMFAPGTMTVFAARTSMRCSLPRSR